MKKYVIIGVGLLVIVALSWGFFRFGYRLGFEPTTFALNRMSVAEKHIALAKSPTGPFVPSELTVEEKQQENKQSVAILDQGIPERLANIVSTSESPASGMVRIVNNQEKLYLVFDEAVSLPPAPSLRVYLSKRASASFDDYGDAYIDLGELKAARGTQVYEIPAGFALEEIKSIGIVNVAYKLIVAKAVIN